MATANHNAPAKGTTAPAKGTNAPAKGTNAGATLPAPSNTFAAPQGRSTVTVVCTPGTTYGIAAPHAGGTVVLPFTVPGKAGGTPVPVVLASTNANWLGRNGAPLAAWLYTAPGNAPGMGVAVQPHASGYKANAYTAGLTCVVLAAGAV